MGVFSVILLTCLFSDGVHFSLAHRIRLHNHRNNRRHRAADGGALRFEPAPYSKKLEVDSAGKIHCKVAGGVAPNVTWFLNEQDPLPEGVTSSNGTLLVSKASRDLAGQYTCKATDGDHSITSKINLDVVVQPRISEPTAGQEVHVTVGQTVWLNCIATGDPTPTTHWDRNLTILNQNKDTVANEDGPNATNARMVLFNNGTLLIRAAAETDGGIFGCTAGSHAGLARTELSLVVHPEGELQQESGGVAGKAVIVSISVAGAYMILVLALMLYCRRRRLKRWQRGEKLEMEMQEGREKLVEEEEKKVGNGNAPIQNGRLLPYDRDSGADNSEVSAISRASKKSGQYDHLSVPKTLLTDQITLGRGEFGDVALAKIDINQVRKLRNKAADTDPKLRPVLVKMLTTKDEAQLTEFRRQLDMFSRVRHENIVRLIGLCNQDEPHYMLLEHTDWGDLKNFLIATRTPEENELYLSRIDSSNVQTHRQTDGRRAAPLSAQHVLLLSTHLACAAGVLANTRYTHRDIAARNCVISSKFHLKLTLTALSRGPDSHEYHKLHDQVIPLRWLPPEAVLESEYSTKSDVYMFAATVWEMYTKAELPFCKLNDTSVMERLKSGSLEWAVPENMPERLARLLRRCWSHCPSERPQFSEITEEVAAILQEITAENKQTVEKADE